MKHALIAAILGTTTLLASGSVLAQAKPEDVIKYRKSALTVAAWHMRPLGAMVKGQMPFDQSVFLKNAEMVAAISQVVPEGFATGSDKGAETRAKPEIWSDAAGFKKVMDNFQAETAKLVQVARTAKDVDAVRGQFAAVGKACHDNYRTK